MPEGLLREINQY